MVVIQLSLWKDINDQSDLTPSNAWELGSDWEYLIDRSDMAADYASPTSIAKVKQCMHLLQHPQHHKLITFSFNIFQSLFLIP